MSSTKEHRRSKGTHSMSLRKGSTFCSSPTSNPSDVWEYANHRLPRSPTCNEDRLRSLVQGIDDRRQTILQVIESYNKAADGDKSSNLLCDREIHPLPSCFLADSSMDTTPMDIDPKPSTVQRSPHEHASDSGLGSSIGSKYGKNRLQLSALEARPSNILKGDAGATSTREYISASVSSTRGAITRSFTALGSSDEKHQLGDLASRLIKETIIDPILAEESLKDFHPLLKDVPRRIGEKNITNIRDLEKTLIFLAPEFSATPKSYLHFCETSIRLLQATVDTLPEADQRLPSDRPYTNNYFLDLIEQIRRYAAIMAATREKEANGEDLDDMDFTPGEKIALRGGLSHNGRPAELVREKDGKVLPLNPESASEEAYKGYSSKRTLSDSEMDEDEVMRSMARRRKSDKPGDVTHVCRECKKDFKRPCDLTKHEKTHSRPWKCSEENCKYYELGWPTEKERDRHVNDKHSAAPPQYKCLYPPCTYASKRESNCKQHMEKAHNWTYIRSKSNGRKKAAAEGSERSAPTPLTTSLGTPQSVALATPNTPYIPSPSVPLLDGFDYAHGFGTPAWSLNSFQDDYRRDSITTDGSVLTYSSGHSPTEPAMFEDALTPEEPSFDHNAMLNCSNLVTNFNAYQQFTPAMSTGQHDFDNLQFTVDSATSIGFPHLSPGAQPNITLYSPPTHMDEGFGDSMEFGRPNGDFTLFDPGNMGLDTTANFFPDVNQLGDVNQMGGQFDHNLNLDLYAGPGMSNFDDLIGGFSNAQ
ncbi:hypothetical protein K504DRAFT_389181 [Pleomassaria siparia CBS 279.74]|uniref:C2H2-type domain-containing protein n=1 Tax=Pleomassaria siparia CBS 279.74 TaxID=1314801 RepID=A0A6G1JXY6_9PLEO|nr:hypothetical protein K504DRAFT_389181 [Pleomassaria siparia CBS 279.74]